MNRYDVKKLILQILGTFYPDLWINYFKEYNQRASMKLWNSHHYYLTRQERLDNLGSLAVWRLKVSTHIHGQSQLVVITFPTWWKKNTSSIPLPSLIFLMMNTILQKKVWSTFEMKTMSDYCRMYCLTGNLEKTTL